MNLSSAIVACALFTVALPVSADPAPASEPGVLRIPVIICYGRPDRPNAVIEFKSPTATAEAGLAHESLRASLLGQSEPGPLRAHAAP